MAYAENILKLSGILLAAGAGSRFGGGKLRHPLADGTPLGVMAARHLLTALPDVLAVVRPGDAALEALLRAAGCEVTVCRREADGWVIALADMPSIHPATITAVAQALAAGAPLAAPTFEGRRGHPVGISARFVSELLALDGDAGARELMMTHKQEIVLLDGDDAGVLLDIDRREDLPRGP